jgi:hypothetical protein
MTDTLPPLPAAVLLCTVMPGDYRYGHVYGYTADQLREYGKACAALPAAQPGYKLMPIEPTMAMSTAFHSARPQTAVEEPDGSWTANAWDCFRASYAAMLYAAVAAQPVTDGVGLVDGNTSSSHTPLKG